jgi:hypothetical protein
MEVTMSKQTAVEWLVEEINKNGEEIHKNGNWIPTHMIEQAKEMEKEQIETAWYDGISGGQCGTSEQYYNETYRDSNE